MSFFDELKRRNVIKVAIAYVVVGWLVSQVAEFATENFGAPEWVLKIFVVFLLLGLPLVLVFAWAFELTPEGIKREKDVDRSQSITQKTGRKLDFTIIGVLVLVAAYFIYESRFQKGSEPFSQAATNSTSQHQEKTDLTPGIAVTTNDQSIAVLPFANRSKLEDDEFFTDGIHDDLLTQLAKIRDLKVISRTSMMKYKDTQLSIPDIANELGVSTILEGGVQRAGKRIRINAQLIDVTNDQHLWAETFDREMTMENIFDIQSEITRQIVSAVRGELTEEESKALDQLPTTSVAAYEAYLKARELTYSANYTPENFINAEPFARQSVALDPEFAQAWGMMAVVHGMAIWVGFDDSPERYQAMKDAVDRAMRLAPDQPSSLLAQAEYHYRVERDFTSSLAALQKAHKALPGDSNILERKALSERRLGRWEDSVNSALQSVLLDPGNVSSARLAIETLANMQEWDRVISLGTQWLNKFESTDIETQVAWAFVDRSGDIKKAREFLDSIPPVAGETYVNFVAFLPLLERDYRAAIDIFDQPEVAALSDDDGWQGWREIQLGFAYEQLGDGGKSRRLYARALEILSDLDRDTHSTNAAFDFTNRAYAHALLGEREKALEASIHAKTMLPESLDAMDGTFIAGRHARILGMTGHHDEALAEIERLLDKPAGLVRWELYLDPQWDFFRDDERFNELIKPLILDEAQQ